MAVLDTAALLHWPIEKISGNKVASSQLNELQKLSAERAMLIETLDLEWVGGISINTVEQAATKTGDLSRLSPVDLDILAVAFEFGEILYTDDYSMQNVCRSIGHPFEPVFNKKSSQQWSWELRCIGCRATKPADSKEEQECDICGSPMKVKKSRN